MFNEACLSNIPRKSIDLIQLMLVFPANLVDLDYIMDLQWFYFISKTLSIFKHQLLLHVLKG